jgi:hypothetical protein
LRLHRDFEMLEAMFDDEDGVRQVEERRHAGTKELVARMFRTKRPKENIDRIRVGRRQVPGKSAGDVAAAIEQFERVETGARILGEAVGRKRRMNAREIRAETTDQSRRKECLERCAHGMRPILRHTPLVCVSTRPT